MPSSSQKSHKQSLFYQNGNLVTATGTTTQRLCRAGPVPIAQVDNHALRTLILQTDLMSSVLGTLRTPNDHHYMPYGFAVGRPVASLIHFTGQLYDRFSACYPLGAGHRYFNPVLMRFIQPDGLSPFDKGGVNDYCYCQGDPINKLDANGRFWEHIMNFGKWTATQILKLANINISHTAQHTIIQLPVSIRVHPEPAPTHQEPSLLTSVQITINRPSVAANYNRIEGNLNRFINTVRTTIAPLTPAVYAAAGIVLTTVSSPFVALASIASHAPYSYYREQRAAQVRQAANTSNSATI